MSGNCDNGMRSNDSTPAIVNRKAITIASLGRSTKTAEIMLRLARSLGCGRWWAGRSGTDLNAWANALDAVGDDHFAVFQPAGNNGGGWRGLSQLNPALLDFVVGADHVDVVALLVGQHCLARDAERRDGLDALDENRHEGAIYERPFYRLTRI